MKCNWFLSHEGFLNFKSFLNFSTFLMLTLIFVFLDFTIILIFEFVPRRGILIVIIVTILDIQIESFLFDSLIINVIVFE